MENTTEESKIEPQPTPINYSIGIEDRIRDLGIHLEGWIKIEDLVKMDKAAGEKEAWELEAVNLNQGRLYPRRKSARGAIDSNYEYGDKLREDERGITPTELFSLFKDGAFKELRGVYISSLREGEFLFLNLKSLELQRHYTSDLPNYANAQYYAFPTIEIPAEE